MPRFMKVAAYDAHNVFKNVISLVVCVGMIVIPSFYAWFNIWGSWDPYKNTANLKVAVVNLDEGYTSDLIPVDVNLGERTESELKASKSIGYTIVDSEDEAVEGVKSGTYYAAVVIPADFSERMLTYFADSTDKPEVYFYQNEKANAIAAIVTDKASAAVQKDINQSFASSLTSAAAGVLDQVGNYLNSDDVRTLATQLDSALAQTQKRLSDTSGNLRSYAAISGSASQLLDQLDSDGSGTLSSALDASGMLRSGTDGVQSLSDALDGATSSINDSFANSASDFDNVKSALDEAFDAAAGHTDQLVDALTQAKGTVDSRVAKLQDLYDSMVGTDAIAKKYRDQLIGSPEWETVNSYEGLIAKVKQALDDAKKLDDGLGKAISDIQNTQSSASDARTTLDGLVDQAKTSITNISSDYEQGLRSSLSDMNSSLQDAASKADAMKTQLDNVSSSLKDTAATASKSMGDVQGSLLDAADQLDGAAAKLGDIHTQIQDALDSGDLDQLRTILSANAEDLASFISTPVSMDRTAVFAVANNGSGMAPFYSTLAIWIGGVVLCALVKTAPSDRFLKKIHARPTDSYIGRIIFFLVIGFFQSTLVIAGDLWFLGVQCQHPMLFFLTGWLESFIFINIIYALTASFGDVGKAIAVVLMVIQVAGSGGTFPKEMLPGVFQKLYPFLPFVHGEDAMRACIAGIYQNDYWFCMLRLACFIIPALLLGLILRRPVIHLNHWLEEKLESTKLM
ncbi:MAG: YhgE/Pip domain-containing protein [Atopobiaceae bacterium]|nr:YhgE/Pip domain-containing protein [Atopobium sp.]MCH4080936.1 YhgE/Pip domain-containing protein [Atopobiaceae bacterium]MCI1344456.1 YhgE/Pip domain-containing protein [Atopobiaceae bacterium]MCI1497466.1 YhgE/Pip domain-containing protein [Atopobiaceae bacterium]MCI1539414.1 YhgE/Pip domain-containing protein [Atopobiaceae bacterium]